jgi:hypothetical protein
MAEGKPVGTMYVELSMDATKYTKAQEAIRAGAEKNSADINKVFKTVGAQSDEMYNAMRKNVENALNAIKRSHISSADEIRRSQESAAQKITQINEQQFGRQTSLISEMKAHWIAASVAIYAAYATINKAWDMAKVGAEYMEQQGILNNLAKKYSTTADSIIADMQRASDYQISKADLMQISLAGIAKGLDASQLINLADAAKILGDAVGKDATTALRDLTEALESGRTKGLKTYLGTALDLKSAFGDLESQMTAAEKTQAMYNITMIAAMDLQKRQTGEVSSTADEMERMAANFENAKLAASNFFAAAIGGLY